MDGFYIINYVYGKQGALTDKLRSMGIEVYLPRINRQQISRDGKVRTRNEPLFPDYMFIRADEDKLLYVKNHPSETGGMMG